MLDEAIFRAGDLMTRDVAVVHPETSLLEAVKLMAHRRISGMPMVDNAGAIVGMIGSDLGAMGPAISAGPSTGR